MGTDFSTIGRLLANPARAAMLDLLLDGRAFTAGELARASGVSASTASGHLNELTRGHLINATAQGRFRYYALAGADIAAALEALAQVCPATTVSSLRQSQQARALGFIRTCYDHLAGTVAVDLLDSLVGRTWLVSAGADYTLTPRGRRGMEEFGVDVAETARGRRHFARQCLDWTERRPHLAGALGGAIAARMFERDWLRRPPHGRGVHITAVGQAGLLDVFAIHPDQDRGQPGRSALPPTRS